MRLILGLPVPIPEHRSTLLIGVVVLVEVPPSIAASETDRLPSTEFASVQDLLGPGVNALSQRVPVLPDPASDPF